VLWIIGGRRVFMLDVSGLRSGVCTDSWRISPSFSSTVEL
jgi:hypothetical protein